MTEFFTKVNVPDPGFNIGYQSKLLFMGSCFSELIGRKMQETKFNVIQNPFGVIYNPLSISKGLQQIMKNISFTEKDINFYNELWLSYSHSTKFSDTNKNTCLNTINSGLKKASDALQDIDVMVLTLGTSWVYELKKTGEVVANCHKIPAENFNRFFSSVNNTVDTLSQTIHELKEINSELKIIFTVSPVRHWKDGAIENQRSKAALILAVTEILQEFENVYYFPAYEIFMDELRDYRFYASDMLHPSESGIDYIWERFKETFFGDKALQIFSEVQSIKKRLDHRALHKNTTTYKKFISSLKKDIVSLQNKNPEIDFSAEIISLNDFV